MKKFIFFCNTLINIDHIELIFNETQSIQECEKHRDTYKIIVSMTTREAIIMEEFKSLSEREHREEQLRRMLEIKELH